MAIDCAGNEIFLSSRVELDAPSKSRELYLVAEYCETEGNPVPIFPGTEFANTRIHEECRVYIMDIDPNSNHDGIGPGTPGCGSPHPMCIARLKGLELIKYGQRAA